jgi:transposase, IS30 family
MAKGYHHLTYGRRCQIEALRKRGVSMIAIAQQLGVHKATISRELKRSSSLGLYESDAAHQDAAKKRKTASGSPKKLKPELISIINEKLALKWSPEQISGSLKKLGERDLCVSFSTIYKYLRRDKMRGGQLFKHLRHGGKKYNKRLNKRAGRGRIPNRVGIEERPLIVKEKSRLGDWEVDTIMSARDGAGALVSLVERYSKWTFLVKVASCHADVVYQAILQCLKSVENGVLTITADNGKEFAKHAEIGRLLNADFYFATPYHSWERGLNEHTNGLVRQYFPKGISFQETSEEEVRAVQEALNHRPRRVLDYRTPYEVFLEHISQLYPLQSLSGIIFS